jgi:hypothetical protein
MGEHKLKPQATAALDLNRVCVAYMHPGWVEGRFMQSLMTTVLQDSGRKPKFYGNNKQVPGSGPRIARGVGAYVQLESGPRVAAGRNILVRQFLDNTTCDWLWMLDADIVFDTLCLDKLLAVADPVERPMVAGLYFGGGRSNPISPIMYRLVDPATTSDGNPCQTIKEWEPGTVIQADATGGGCLLAHRSVFEKLRGVYPPPHHWFMESVYNGMEFGEDWTFFLRTGAQGIPLYIHTGVNIGHAKTFEIREEHFDNPKNTEAPVNVTHAEGDFGPGMRKSDDGSIRAQQGMNHLKITPMNAEE